MLLPCLTAALVSLAPVSPLQLEDRVRIDGAYATLDDVADLSVLPDSLRSSAQTITVARMHAPEQTLSTSAIAARARTALPALAPWLCGMEDKTLRLHRADVSLRDDPVTPIHRGQALTLTVSIGRVEVERAVWALQDGNSHGVLFVGTADRQVLRVDGASLR